MTTVFLGRFQPFHQGHKHVIEQNKEDDLVLVIGSAEESRTDENPLNTEERKQLIRKCFPEIPIYTLKDYESDEKWSEKLLEKTQATKIISGNEWVKKALKTAEVEVVEPEMHDPGIYSGTEVRRRINSGGEWSYLVPECSREKLKQLVKTIENSGTQYKFEPGWKKENSFYGTAEK